MMNGAKWFAGSLGSFASAVACRLKLAQSRFGSRERRGGPCVEALASVRYYVMRARVTHNPVCKNRIEFARQGLIDAGLVLGSESRDWR